MDSQSVYFNKTHPPHFCQSVTLQHLIGGHILYGCVVVFVICKEDHERMKIMEVT